jgi:hypothetical protein
MRLPGYCTECHRIRQVTVSMSQFAATRTPTGVCVPCERRADLSPDERRMLFALERHGQIAVDTAPDRRTAQALVRADFAYVAEGNLRYEGETVLRRR